MFTRTGSWMLMLGSVMAMGGTAEAGPVLIGVSHVIQGGHAPVQSDARAQFTLTSLALNGNEQASIGHGVFWGLDDHGIVDFPNDGSGSFALLAGILTNGVDDQVLVSTKWAHGAAGGIIYNESLFFGREPESGSVPDLFGYELTQVRLTVNDFHFEEVFVTPGVTTIEYEANVTFAFFGAPVPEPATTLLVLLGVGITVAGRPRNSARFRRRCGLRSTAFLAVGWAIATSGSASSAVASMATFDTLTEGLYGDVLTDGGITFFQPDARSSVAPNAFAIDDVADVFALFPNELSSFTPPNVLGVGAFGPGSLVGGSAQFGEIRATRGRFETYASVDVFHFAVEGFTIGNSIALEGYRNGVLVVSDSIEILDCCAYHDVLEIGGAEFDTIRLAGYGPFENGVFFGAIDNVVMVPEPSVGFLLLLRCAGMVLRRPAQPIVGRAMPAVARISPGRRAEPALRLRLPHSTDGHRRGQTLPVPCSGSVARHGPCATD